MATVAAGLHPSADRVSDALLAAALGVAVAAAGTVARTWAWLLVAGVAGVATLGPAAGPAVVALVIAWAFALSRDLPARRLAGAVIAGLALQSLLRIDGGPFGWSAGLTAAAVGVLFLSGWGKARRRSLRILRHAGLVLAAVTFGLAAAFTLAVLQARSSVETGIRLANEGLAAANAGDTERAADLLDGAERRFADAHRGLGGWLARPARVLPVVGPQARALDLVTGAGRDVAARAAEAARRADVQSLTVDHGRLDLARVEAMRGPLESVSLALRAAVDASGGASSGGLLPPVASRLERVALTIDDARADADTASQAVDVVPALFGGTEPRRYFVAFTNPSEARALGGFTGAYAEVLLDGGRIELLRHGGIEELNEVRRGRRRLTDPAPFPDRFLGLQPEQFWQNVTGTADFPTTAEAVRQLWPQSGGDHLDGVLLVDPYALAALLELTGPVAVDGLDMPLSASNAADFLLRDQYRTFGVIDERLDFLAAATGTVFDALTSASLPGPRRVADVLGPAVRGRRLLLHSFHDDEQALFERLGADGSVPAPDGSDFLSVRSSNRAANKIDSLLERSLDHSVTVDPERGTVRSTLSVTLRSSAPSVGLPDYIIRNDNGRPFGTNIMTVEVASPLDLVSVTRGGEPAGVTVGSEYGRPVYATLVEVPPESEVVLTFTLAGRLDLSDGYHLTLLPQAVVNPDRVRVEVSGQEGWGVVSSPAPSVAELREQRQVSATFRRV
ncbi:MAG: DUF4012 domain-containing protein [Acidimicrobiales bacterium]